MFIDMGRPYRRPGDPRARSCSPFDWSSRRPCLSSVVVFHGDRGLGRSKEARVDDRVSSLDSGVLRNRLAGSFGPVPTEDCVLRWERFSKCDKSEDTGLCCGQSG